MYFSPTWTEQRVKKVAAALQAEGGSAFGFEANAGSRDAMAESC